jgi:hypothetical protein
VAEQSTADRQVRGSNPLDSFTPTKKHDVSIYRTVGGVVNAVGLSPTLLLGGTGSNPVRCIQLNKHQLFDFPSSGTVHYALVGSNPTVPASWARGLRWFIKSVFTSKQKALLAEWSNAIDSSSILFGGAGSNPAQCILATHPIIVNLSEEYMATSESRLVSNSWLLPLLCNEVPHCRGPQSGLLNGAMAELDRMVYPGMKSIRGRSHITGTTTSCKRWAFRLLLLDYYIRHYAEGRISVFPQAPLAHGVESNFTPESLKWLTAAYATLDDIVWNRVEALRGRSPQNNAQEELLHSGAFGPIPLYNLFALNRVDRATNPVPVAQVGVKESMLAQVSTGLTFYTMCVVKEDWESRMKELGVVDHVFTFIISSEGGAMSSYINSSYGAGCLRQSQMTRPLTPDQLVHFANVISHGNADADAAYADMFFPNPHQGHGDSDDESGPLETLTSKEAHGVVSQRPVILWMKDVPHLIDYACGNIDDFKGLVKSSGLVAGDESSKIPWGSLGGGKRTRRHRRHRRRSLHRTSGRKRVRRSGRSKRSKRSERTKRRRI